MEVEYANLSKIHKLSGDELLFFDSVKIVLEFRFSDGLWMNEIKKKHDLAFSEHPKINILKRESGLRVVRKFKAE